MSILPPLSFRMFSVASFTRTVLGCVIGTLLAHFSVMGALCANSGWLVAASAPPPASGVPACPAGSHFEAGVGCVTLAIGGWDTHDENDKGHKDLCKAADQPHTGI